MDAEFKRVMGQWGTQLYTDIGRIYLGTFKYEDGVKSKQMFQKKITKSDTDNNLIIYKGDARKYFSQPNKNTYDNVLMFYDKTMKLWEFHYRYLKNTKTFVFTRGWKQFLKENRLKAMDVVSFFNCEDRKGHTVTTYFRIDIKRCKGAGSVVSGNFEDVKRCEGDGSVVSGNFEDIKPKGVKIFGVYI